MWLDHRQQDAERVRAALAALDDPGMVDPLGFGIIRDAFSDLLFPGTSTIQTRARYFLFVPWIFQLLDEQRVTGAAAAARIRKMELDLIQALLEGSDDPDGIIGQRSWPNTKALPSLIYWGGLGTWRIRRFAGTRYDYFNSLDQPTRADEEEFSRWHPGLPPQPEDLFDATSLDLEIDEADFLRDQILGTAGDSYLAILVRDGSLHEVTDTPWAHPQAHAAPPEIREHVNHAKLFAVATWGAGLVYNDWLSSLLKKDGFEGLSVDYRAMAEDWLVQMDLYSRDFSTWDREAFWFLVRGQSGRVPEGLVSFVDSWLDQVLADPSSVLTDDGVRSRLRDREASIKGARAKLASRGARERSATAQGAQMQLFRWPTVRRVLADIHAGLDA